MTFDKIAKQLANPTGSLGIKVGLGMNKMNTFISKTSYHTLNIMSQDHVLEIGLGNGKFVRDVLNLGEDISYTGLDVSETMIQEAKKLNSNLVKTGRVNFIQGDVSCMPFSDNTFDKICMINTIYFLEAPIIALEEVYRLLKNHGIFIISYRPYIKGESLDFSKFGFIEYKSEDLRSIIEKSKFKILKIIDETEPEIEFNGQIYRLSSQYFVMQKIIEQV